MSVLLAAVAAWVLIAIAVATFVRWLETL